MDEVFIPIFLFLVIGAIILVPVWLRHRFYKQQLEVISKAIEQGVDPERIQLRLPSQDDGDINGNWKAGWILIGIAVAFVLCVMLPLYAAGEIGTASNREAWVMTVVPGTLLTIGICLLYFHRHIVGKVYRHGEPRPLRGGGADLSSVS